MANSTKPRAIERWLEGRLPGYRFGLVLLFLLVTFVFMASGITGSWVRVVTVGLQGLTLLAALRASQVHRRTFRIAALVALVAFVSALASVAITASQDATGAIFVLNTLVVAGAPIAIANALWRRSVVDIHTVLGAICIYVLVGMMFAFRLCGHRLLRHRPLLRADERCDNLGVPLLQLHHAEHGWLRRLHRRREPGPQPRVARRSPRPAVPGDDRCDHRVADGTTQSESRELDGARPRFPRS